MNLEGRFSKRNFRVNIFFLKKKYIYSKIAFTKPLSSIGAPPQYFWLFSTKNHSFFLLLLIEKHKKTNPL
jgi:hypothetical protein